MNLSGYLDFFVLCGKAWELKPIQVSSGSLEEAIPDGEVHIRRVPMRGEGGEGGQMGTILGTATEESQSVKRHANVSNHLQY